MANPQIEDGHTQIANELLERLMKLYLSPNQWQVLLCIIRKTYGYKKKLDYIANSQIQASTGLGKSVVSRALRELQGRDIINRNGKVAGIQKDWERWKVSSSGNFTKVSSTGNFIAKVISSGNFQKLAVQATELAEQATKVSSCAVAQKKKETIQKKDIIPLKKNYGEFSNVLLTDEEHQKLIERFGPETTAHSIENLSAYMASRSKKYKSHYATIINWQRRDGDNAKAGSSRALPKTYTPTPEYPDL